VKEIYSSISQREELIDFVSWQEEVVSCPITIEQPIATYFKKRYDVKYLIVVMRSGGSEIENLKITIYHLPRDFNFKITIQEVIVAFENGGWQGIEDLKSRFETGVGIGSQGMLECSL
jgi:hypothetical protein